jgi:hypothetical protein
MGGGRGCHAYDLDALGLVCVHSLLKRCLFLPCQSHDVCHYTQREDRQHTSRQTDRQTDRHTRKLFPFLHVQGHDVCQTVCVCGCVCVFVCARACVCVPKKSRKKSQGPQRKKNPHRIKKNQETKEQELKKNTCTALQQRLARVTSPLFFFIFYSRISDGRSLHLPPSLPVATYPSPNCPPLLLASLPPSLPPLPPSIPCLPPPLPPSIHACRYLSLPCLPPLPPSPPTSLASLHLLPSPPPPLPPSLLSQSAATSLD